MRVESLLRVIKSWRLLVVMILLLLLIVRVVWRVNLVLLLGRLNRVVIVVKRRYRLSWLLRSLIRSVL